MEEDISRIEGLDVVAPLAHSVVAVAVSGSRKTKFVVKWALEKFVPEGQVYFRLLHVRWVISRIPTPMGNYLSISQVRGDAAAAFKQEAEWQVNEKLLPYKKMCSRRKVQVEVVQIESDDVVNAIAGEIRKHKIEKLVIGTSSCNFFSRGRRLSSQISETCPTFCTVYTVSKGRLSSMRSSDLDPNRNSFREDSYEIGSTDDYSSQNSISRADWTESSLGISSNYHSASLPTQRFQALSTINQPLLHKRRPSAENMYSKDIYADTAQGPNVNGVTSEIPNYISPAVDDLSWDQALTSDASAENQGNKNLELEKLRIELRHVRGMYAIAQDEATDTSRKLNELQKRRVEEEINLKKISLKEKEAKELARQVKEKYEKAKREAQLVKECAEREAVERKEVELRASNEIREKEKLESTLNGCFHQYRLFTWEEIVSATSEFSEDLKVGMGAYGTVYKCSFLHTTAAVKVLHSKEAGHNKQFHQELEILSRIRHPHLLILLGACPERSCLIYEYMENGSLEDALMKKVNAPLLWFDRFRIAWEVASALVFLHNTKPNAIVHRDLKPANILLDRNYVSKIGDVGLSTMVKMDPHLVSATFKDSGPVGTLCYIDPEYQRTGVVSPKSDVYAFGMVILQLLTAKPATAIAHKVEVAITNGQLLEILDPEAGRWPVKATKELAIIALNCTELRRADRPDLLEHVLPVLEKLRDFAEKARNSAIIPTPMPPKHFTCPILKEVMSDPCVAADGYTYDRRAIEAWLNTKDTSPITGSPLPHKHLVPNYALLSAIMDWKSGK